MHQRQPGSGTAAASRFTLIELLVVITIILILAAILLPALGQARAYAHKTKCIGQLDQFGIALAMYRDENDGKMAPWLSHLYPKPLDSSRIYVCPSDPAAGSDGGRSGAGWPRNYGDGLLKDITPRYNVTCPAGVVDEHDLIDQDCPDEYFDTDDTANNNSSWNTGIRFSRNTAISKCSYMYEFPETLCLWAERSNGTKFTGWTWNRYKDEQLRCGYGNAAGTPWDASLFPAVRCFYHWTKLWGKTGLVLNAAYDGRVFQSKIKWEEGTF